MGDSDFTLTKDFLWQIFDYKDGKLIWKFPLSKNIRLLGMEAGSLQKNGYICIKIKNKLYKAHRLVFLMHKGYLPEFIDHIDNCPSNNKIENLREATKAENGYNRKINRNNKSGVKGVSWDGQAGKWKARCWVNKRLHTLGLFNSVAEAAIVVKSERERLHGEFARHS